MLKTRRNIPIDLRKKQNIINLEHVDLGPWIITAAVIMILVISVLCVAAYPNSNMVTTI